MAQPIVMPKLAQTVEESTLVKWRRKVGDTVRKGDILFEIETDKAVLEVESFYDGTLLRILVSEGETVPVQTTVAFLGQPGEKVPDSVPRPAAAPATPASPRAAPPQGAPAPRPAALAVRPPSPTAALAAPPPPPAAPGRAPNRASPRARALARASAIDISHVSGTGPGGRVVEHDVQAYMAAAGYDRIRITPAAKKRAIDEGIDILALRGTADGGRIVMADITAALAERPKPMSRMRQVIAERLTLSATTIPHFFVTVSVDMTDLLALRKQLKAQGRPYSVTDFILEAVVLALIEFPTVNSATDGKAVRWNSHVHLGMAVSIENGLVVPVVRFADQLSLAEIHEQATALALRARDGKLTPDEMTGSTFTVSNMGMLDVENFTAIINPGETAILAVATTNQAPAVRDGRVVVRSVMKMTLSSDHRLVDGATAARFANAIKSRLEDTELWKSLT